MFTSSYKRFLFGILVFSFGLSVMGQSVALYSKDGGRFDYPTAEIDSIVFTERQPLPLTKPEYVEAVAHRVNILPLWVQDETVRTVVVSGR